MQRALHIRTTVLPGGRVEVASPERRLFQTAEEVKAYLAEDLEL